MSVPILMIFGLVVGCGSQPEQDATSKVGSMDAARARAGLAPCPPGVALGMPEEQMPCLGGGPAVPVSAPPGRPLLVNFYNALCWPCQEELPLLREYSSRPDSVSLLGVDAQDTEETALAFVTDFQARWPVILDDNGLLFRRFAGGWPVSIVVRADGRVAGPAHVGAFKSVDEIAGYVASSLE